VAKCRGLQSHWRDWAPHHAGRRRFDSGRRSIEDCRAAAAPLNRFPSLGMTSGSNDGKVSPGMPSRLSLLRVRPVPGNRARGWLTAGPFRLPCALGPAGVVRTKREGDGGTPAGRFPLLWGYFRPDHPRPRAGGVPLKAMRRNQGWCEDPSSARYNRPVRLPAADCTDKMWRDDHLYDLTFVLDQNFIKRSKGRGSAIFFHLARPGFAPTAGCVAISASDMRKLAPRLARGAVMAIG
jgi:L,D-peptidoglycan transpeptidase YkuD (ErfK/YbiS/YcfS/YnhG family)